MAEHPVTPPPELRRLWAQQAQRMYPRDSIAWQEHIANQAARWSADPDLWAYVKWIEDCGHHPSVSTAHWSNSMTEHPITPPPELVAKLWREASAGRDDAPIGEIFNHGVLLAYAAGADQELEACLMEVRDGAGRIYIDETRLRILLAEDLRAARRPKPPSLKELALLRTDAILNNPNPALPTEVRETLELNRRALEALPDD